MRDRLPFSHLLPLIDLALLVILVFVPITMSALHLYSASKGSDSVHIHSGAIEIAIPRSQIVPWAIRDSTMAQAQRMMMINLPGALFQGLISLPSSERNHSGWHPQALTLETWQALVFPFFALPFWWLVGCGLDSLIYKERRHWSLLLLGTLLFGFCFAANFTHDPNAPAGYEDVWLFRALIAWTVGFATLPAAWITQSIRQRRSTNP
jgi:hypothetical protein